MIREILKEEKKTVIGMFISVLVGMLIITTIWKHDYTENIPFGILDEDGSSLSQSIVRQFQINPTLDITYYADSEQDLKAAILSKKIEAGIMIPRHFSRDLSLKKSPQAVIFADCSNIITGGGAVGAASAVMGTMSAGTQLKMLEGSNFYPSKAAAGMGTFTYVDRTLYEPQGDYIRKMSYLLVPTITMQTFLISFFIPLLIRKRRLLARADKPTARREIKEALLRTAVVAGGGTLVQFPILCIISIYKHIPMRGEIVLFILGTAIFMAGTVAFGLLLGAFTHRLSCFVQMYLTCSNLVVFTSGLIFPFYLMPRWLSIASRLFSPVANMAPVLKAINLKGISWDAALPAFVPGLLYAAFWLAAGSALYVRSIKKESIKGNISLQAQ